MTWDLFAMYSEFLDDDSLANSDEDALADLVDAQVDIMDELDEDEQNKARLRVRRFFSWCSSGED